MGNPRHQTDKAVQPKLGWPQTLSLAGMLLGVILALAAQYRDMPRWLSSLLIACVAGLSLVILTLAAGPMILELCRAVIGRNRRARVLRQECMPELNRALRILDERLFNGAYIYSLPAVRKKLTGKGTKDIGSVDGLDPLRVLDYWRHYHGVWAQSLSRKRPALHLFKATINGLVSIAQCVESLVRKSEISCIESAGAEGRRAWTQFCADYHDFVASVERASGAAAEVLEGILEQRFDRLPTCPSPI